MRSVATHGSVYGRFKNSLDAGHLSVALSYATEMRVVPLEDALRVCQLMARDDDPRFARAASRWLERLSSEAGAGLLEVQMAAAALGKLWEEPESEVALSTLSALLSK